MPERFQEKIARIDTLIYIPGALGEGIIAEALSDFFIDQSIDEIESVLGDLPYYFKDEFGDAESSYQQDLIIDFLQSNEKNGFIANFTTPIMRPHGSSGTSYYWGRYTAKWIYGDTMEDLLNAGFQWVDSVREMEKECSS